MTLRKGAQTSAVNPRRYLPYHTEVTANCQTLIPPAALCARTLKEPHGADRPGATEPGFRGEAAPASLKARHQLRGRQPLLAVSAYFR